MKQFCRFCGVFLCALILVSVVLPVSAQAYGSPIDTSTANEGYFSVYYTGVSGVKMKVALVNGSDTTYLNYVPGDVSSYTFPDGDGYYTIILYQNVSGTSYREVYRCQTSVTLEDEFAPYLVSTEEISFSKDDVVGSTAAMLCKYLKNTDDKVVAIHNYIASNFTYDNAFADEVNRGNIKNYVPDTTEILTTQAGVCYDFSALFAAMCRSQGIACDVQKGYYNGAYHAWNTVYVEGEWVSVDLTASIAYDLHAYSLDQCLIATGYGTAYTY